MKEMASFYIHLFTSRIQKNNFLFDHVRSRIVFHYAIKEHKNPNSMYIISLSSLNSISILPVVLLFKHKEFTGFIVIIAALYLLQGAETF